MRVAGSGRLRQLPAAAGEDAGRRRCRASARQVGAGAARLGRSHRERARRQRRRGGRARRRAGREARRRAAAAAAGPDAQHGVRRHPQGSVRTGTRCRRAHRGGDAARRQRHVQARLRARGAGGAARLRAEGGDPRRDGEHRRRPHPQYQLGHLPQRPRQPGHAAVVASRDPVLHRQGDRHRGAAAADVRHQFRRAGLEPVARYPEQLSGDLRPRPRRGRGGSHAARARPADVLRRRRGAGRAGLLVGRDARQGGGRHPALRRLRRHRLAAGLALDPGAGLLGREPDPDVRQGSGALGPGPRMGGPAGPAGGHRRPRHHLHLPGAEHRREVAGRPRGDAGAGLRPGRGAAGRPAGHPAGGDRRGQRRAGDRGRT